MNLDSTRKLQVSPFLYLYELVQKFVSYLYDFLMAVKYLRKKIGRPKISNRAELEQKFGKIIAVDGSSTVRMLAESCIGNRRIWWSQSYFMRAVLVNNMPVQVDRQGCYYYQHTLLYPK